MKNKRLFFICICFVSTALLFSQQILNSTFTVLPNDVFIGDKIEIRYAFSTNIKLLDIDQKLTIPAYETQDFTISNIELRHTNSLYELVIFCTPWTSGELKIDSINISDYSDNLSTDFVIKIPSIQVKSIIEHTQKTQLQPVVAPLVVPGTTWIIYLLIILCFAAVVALFILAFNLKKHFAKWSNFVFFVKQKITYKKTIKKIKNLNKNSAKYSHKDFATELNTIIHSFLSNRFNTNFYSATTAQIPVKLNEMFDSLLPKEILEQIDNLYSILLRLDFIRFSGLDDSSTDFSFVERSSTTNNLLTIFEIFQKNI